MKKQETGFTLMELMIAVALVGILAMMAVPAYSGYLQRSARANVQADLMAAAGAMERHKSQNFSYSGATAGTGTATLSSRSPVDAEAGLQKYDVSLTFLNSAGTSITGTQAIAGFEILATSTDNFTRGQTETLKINHLGQKCYKALAVTATPCVIGTDPTWK